MSQPAPSEIRTFELTVVLALAVVAVLPVLFFGPPVGTADLIHHLQIAGAHDEAFRSGKLLSDWSATHNGGYGGIVARFYPPVIGWTLAAFNLMFANWAWSVFAAFVFWSMVGAVGTYLILSQINGSRLATIAGMMLFVFAPYHLNQFYNSFMWGEFAALSILPFCFYFSRRISTTGKVIDAIGLAVSATFLVLSNLPQTIIGLVCIVVFAMLMSRRTDLRRVVGLHALALLLAAACSSFYLVRLVMEMDWLKISQPNDDPVYDFRNHFLLNGLEFDAGGVWLASLFLFFVVGSAVSIAAAASTFRAMWNDRPIRAWLVTGLFCIFMMLPASKFVWTLIPPLQRVQFPWRFMSVLCIVLSVVTVFSVRSLVSGFSFSRRPAALIVAGIILITLTFSVRQVIMGAVFANEQEFNDLAEISRHTSNLEHWLPIWSNPTTFAQREQISAIEREVEVIRWDTDGIDAAVKEGPPQTLRLALLYYPYWHAKVNGQRSELRELNGATAVQVGPGPSEVRLRFEEPIVYALSRVISLACALVLIVIAFYKIFWLRNPGKIR